MKDISIETSYSLSAENDELNSTGDDLEVRFSNQYFDLLKISIGYSF